MSGFLVHIQNQRSKIDPCAKFQPNWMNDKGARITENCLMTSYIRLSDDVSKIFSAFESFRPRVPSLENK